MFRFAYSHAFLRWALQPPGFRREWHCGVRATASGKLLAFISGVPAKLRVRGSLLRTVEINFLCVHKKLRHKRLAPVLIKVRAQSCVRVAGQQRAAWGTGRVCAPCAPLFPYTCPSWHLAGPLCAGDHAARQPPRHLAGGVHCRRGAAQAHRRVPVLAPLAQPQEAHQHWWVVRSAARCPALRASLRADDPPPRAYFPSWLCPQASAASRHA